MDLTNLNKVQATDHNGTFKRIIYCSPCGSLHFVFNKCKTVV